MSRRPPLWQKIQNMVKHQTGPVYYYPPLAVFICRKLYQAGHSLGAISEMSSVPIDTLYDWSSSSAQGPWVKELPKTKKVVMPESAEDCLLLAAEMLWHASRPV